MVKLEDFRHEITEFLEKVREFAREDLGCECPDHVFEQVRFLRGEASPGRTNLSVVVGETLLVLFAEYEEIQPFDYEMPRLVLSGVTYRDSIGLNRFRLVMSGDVPREHQKALEEEAGKYDDKVHVHFLE